MLERRLTLWHAPGACSTVAVIALEEARAAYDIQRVDLAAGEQRDGRFRDINPKGKVPVLSIGEMVLTELPVILLWLHEQFESAALLPAKSRAQAHFACLSDLDWCAATLHPIVRQIAAPSKFTAGSTDDVRADGIGKFHEVCTLLSARVSGGWLHGDWTVGDAYVHWICLKAALSGFPLDEYPAIVRHSERAAARPTCQRALACG